MKNSSLMMASACLVVALLVEPAEAQRPNVVLMLADNLSYGDLSFDNDGISGTWLIPGSLWVRYPASQVLVDHAASLR